MAEVLEYWPDARKPAPQSFKYPWDQWMELDENGHGDIWLAELGIDWPADSNVANFRNVLYTRTAHLNKRRKRDAPLVLMRVKGTDKVKKVPKFTPMKVKIRTVSDTQIAFQFYEGDEPPMPQAKKVAVPRRRPIRQRVAGSTVQKVKVPA